MTDERPLHVRVAEALMGCDMKRDSLVTFDGTVVPWEGDWYCQGCAMSDGARHSALRYDTDWSATGPLIERYGIALYPPDPGLPAWTARSISRTVPPLAEVFSQPFGQGETPLIAVANLLLALHAAGRLER